MTTPNPFEQLGRERKAQAIAKIVWRMIPAPDRTRTDLGDKVGPMPLDERNAVARAAGQHEPSDETWARVCEILDEKAEEERHLLGFLDRIEATA